METESIIPLSEIAENLWESYPLDEKYRKVIFQMSQLSTQDGLSVEDMDKICKFFPSISAYLYHNNI